MNSEINKAVTTGLSEQFGAAIEMLEKTIDLCPIDLWEEESEPSY